MGFFDKNLQQHDHQCFHTTKHVQIYNPLIFIFISLTTITFGSCYSAII